MMSPWLSIKHLFGPDDGSLPDIFVSGLSSEEVVMIYEWLMSRCQIARDPVLWDSEQQKDVLIRDIPRPARAYVDGKVETFRHCLSGLTVEGVVIPELSVAVEHDMISFDYRMGPAWNEMTVDGLFQLLWQIQKLAPQAQIFRTDENAYQHPNADFGQAFQSYCLACQRL